jgi:hypothetical protein
MPNAMTVPVATWLTNLRRFIRSVLFFFFIILVCSRQHGANSFALETDNFPLQNKQLTTQAFR